MNDIYASEADELRAATREAHETMQDLEALLKRCESIQKEIAETAATAVQDIIDVAVATGLENYQETLKNATDAATQAVFDRFDKIMDVILGNTKSGRRKGDSIPQMLQKGQAVGLFRPDVDLSELGLPLPRDGVAGLTPIYHTKKGKS